MMDKAELIRKAEEKAAENGHDMGDWMQLLTPDCFWSHCFTCGMTAVIRLNPQTDLGERAISGAATLNAEPITEPQIWQAWHVEHDPDEGDYSAAFEHGQWWVTGWDSDDERHTYSVVEVAGPSGPLGFEEV